jgi:RHS repeat-associated protein
LAWYQCDHLGTPQELTDSQGNLAWTAQYKAWGQVTEQRSEWARQHGVTNPIRFQGQYHDHETGLHYNRHRYYDPSVGRFISKDPARWAGGLNFYAYAPNPIQWVDPLGLARVKGITPNNKGTVESDNLPQTEIGFSKRALGNGIHHPVVAELYEDVHIDDRSVFHGDCGEADALSNIAKKHNVQTVDELKALTKGGRSTTRRNDGVLKPFCKSCKQVMGRLEMEDGAIQ